MALRVKLICKSAGVELEIPANPYPMYPYVECLNYVALDSATGHRHVFADGPIRVNASLEFKGLSHDFVNRYEQFILNRAELGKVPFGIVCPPYINLGLGMGQSVGIGSNAGYMAYYFGPPTLKDIIKPRGDAGLYYDIELPYIILKEANV